MKSNPQRMTRLFMNPIHPDQQIDRLKLLRHLLLGSSLILWVFMVSGCLMPAGPKASVTHSPLQPAYRPHAGTLVLREAVGSYDNKRKVIGSRNLHGAEFLTLLFCPQAAADDVMKIAGHNNLNETLLAFFSETLQSVGYHVAVQPNAHRSLPRKLRDASVLEFDIRDFDYGFGSTRGEPDTIKIDVTLQLLEPHGTNVLWTQRYCVKDSGSRMGAESMIRMGVDDLLQQMTADFASSEFASKIQNFPVISRDTN
ncbi:MAG: hypothetical protein WCH99_07415 [Verrucomicrobiota bacterium]